MKKIKMDKERWCKIIFFVLLKLVYVDGRSIFFFDIVFIQNFLTHLFHCWISNKLTVNIVRDEVNTNIKSTVIHYIIFCIVSYVFFLILISRDIVMKKEITTTWFLWLIRWILQQNFCLSTIYISFSRAIVSFYFKVNSNLN